MTKFTDGPAKGITLMLGRAPVFIRVVDRYGEWDALDRMDDEARPSEKIYAYRLHGEVGGAYIDTISQAGRREGRFVVVAEYKFVRNQPTDGEMRSNSAWQAWCTTKWSDGSKKPPR